MRRRSKIAIILAATSALVGASPHSVEAPPETPTTRPNILVIVADDLGFNDLGAFGGEIRTPNLDRLADTGVKLSRFYTAPACSPTRSMLLTGRDNHKVGFGTMLEVAAPEQRGADGYEGHLPLDTPTLAERLRRAGYQTFMSGKWHLGRMAGQGPADRGFDRSFALLQGAANHFGADQSEAYRRVGAAPDYRLDGRPVEFPRGGYSSDVFAGRMEEFLSGSSRDRPFFAYLAFTAPHWPLQAPPEDIARYAHRYDGGPRVLQADRLARMKRLGLVSPKVRPYPIDFTAWDRLSVPQKAIEARKMEVYAAMVDRMDQNVGRVVASLRRKGALANTIIVFMSDNGPEGLTFSAPINPSDPTKPIDAPLDSSLKALGSANSYFSYGPLWGQVGSTPFRGTKEATSEGGIHAAAFVSGRGKPGRVNGSFLHVTDLFPTLLQWAGAREETTDRRLEGRSWAGLVAGEIDRVRDQSSYQGWELFFRRASRRGNMKAIYQPDILPIFGGKPATGVRWQLYDLSNDPGETKDLASDQPATLRQLTDLWEAFAKRNGVVLPAPVGSGRKVP